METGRGRSEHHDLQVSRIAVRQEGVGGVEIVEINACLPVFLSDREAGRKHDPATILYPRIPV